HPAACVREEESVGGGVADGAVDVPAVRQAQRHGLPAARAQPVGERDLRLLRLGEIEDLLVRGSTQLLRELTLEVVKQGLPPHPAHASAPEGPCTPDPSTGRHANDGQPTGTRVHMDAIRDQPTATDIKHHPGETSMVMLRSAAAATSASLAAWLLGGWALRLAGRGLLRVRSEEHTSELQSREN